VPLPSIDARLAAWGMRVESALERALPPATTAPERLHAAMRYSALAGGKRVRPALVYATGEMLELAPETLDAPAAAVEMIHVYSLVHDDLPAMDDDDLRRGRPSCHRQFDEATAILAGDALQVLSFAILAACAAGGEARLGMIGLLAAAAGTAGMAGGQAIDLAAAGGTLDCAAVEDMHRRKTGALIEASVLLPMHLAGRAAGVDYAALGRFGACLGLAFQIVDDILDVEGDPRLLGKATGADRARGKPTYPAVAGLAQARARVAALHREAIAELDALGSAAAPLVDLAGFLVGRAH
jgi:geranylgeranyl pyrophosphate synthase